MKKAFVLILLLLQWREALSFRPSFVSQRFTGNPTGSRSLRKHPLFVQKEDNSVNGGTDGVKKEPATTEPQQDAPNSIMSSLDPLFESSVIVSSKWLQSESYNLIQPAIIGVLCGFSVAVFKLSIEQIRALTYGSFLFPEHPELLLFIPALGGLVVGLIETTGRFSPGLRDTVKQVDQEEHPVIADFSKLVEKQIRFLRKTTAAVFTLGSGCSLGPEGPSVELGMNLSRFIMDAVVPRKEEDSPASAVNTPTAFPSDMQGRNRLLLSCGAAAGVSAGFNAPIAGIFFVLEVMQNAFNAVDNDKQDDSPPPKSFLSTTGSISAILLASVLSALVSRALLGDTLVLELSAYSLETPLLELPIYLVLGSFSGLVAFLFSQTANLSQSFFKGQLGPEAVQTAMKSTPQLFKPALGGLFCGVVGLVFPQILFFGYETLNSLLATDSISSQVILSLLFVKLITTAVSAGSGLVGGTFAPSLFLGTMLGASFHHGLVYLFETASSADLVNAVPGPVLELADVQAYAMVGAGSVLAALFRAPLTASLLLFELTRDYGVILPLLASAGVGSVVGDIFEARQAQLKERKERRDQDTVSWGDLSDKVNDSKYGFAPTGVEESSVSSK